MNPLAAAGFFARPDGLRAAEAVEGASVEAPSTVAWGSSDGRELEQAFAALLHHALGQAPDVKPPAVRVFSAEGRQALGGSEGGPAMGGGEVVGREGAAEAATPDQAGAPTDGAPGIRTRGLAFGATDGQGMLSPPFPPVVPGAWAGDRESVRSPAADDGNEPPVRPETRPSETPERLESAGDRPASAGPVRRPGTGPSGEIATATARLRGEGAELSAASSFRAGGSAGIVGAPADVPADVPAPDVELSPSGHATGRGAGAPAALRGDPRRPGEPSPVVDRPVAPPRTSTVVDRVESPPERSGSERSPRSETSATLQPSAATAQPVAAPQPTPAVDDDPVEMDPRLRTAVGRVVQRLQSEHGIEARVVEGYRTPERQRALYAQGRTRPGDVVTWTLDSAHTRGRAVDIILDGQWTDLEPYRVLQEVAREEGLATLGMRDPGHLELPDSVPETWPKRWPEPFETEGRRGTSTLARAARVAGVAGQAQVARPAAPAVPGVRTPSPPPSSADPSLERAPLDLPLLDAPPRLPEPDPEDLRLPDGRPFEAVAQGTDRTRLETRVGEGAPSRPAPSTSDASPAAPSSTGERSAPIGASQDPGSAGSVDGASRVERVRAIQEAAGRTGQRMHVDLGDVDGHGTRVRVDLRGGQVGARIDVTDPSLGATLERELGTLRSSLEGRGLESDGIRVRLITEELSPVRAVPRGPEVQAGSEAQARDFRDRPRHDSSDSGQPREQPRHDDLRHRRREENRRDDR